LPCDDLGVSLARPVVLFIIALATSLLASCGGGGDDSSSEPSVPAGHQAVAVIEGWVDALSEGDVDGAAGYFALPSVAENGALPVTLDSRADVIAFNRSLPCGAKLVRARPLGRFIAATFRLTDRPGGDCGSGSGQLARTAFVIRDGKIAQWRRLPNPPRNDGGGGPIV
jgi:hypothetical protein